MRKIRYWWAVGNLFIRRFRIHIFVGIVLGLGIFLLRSQIFAIPIFATTEKIGLVGRDTPDTLPLFILEEMSLGLTSLNEEKIVQPALAQSWETAEDGKIWTFRLKENVFWQDGQALISTDIKYNFPGVEVSYPDKTTLEFRLPDPYSAFPILVSRPVFKHRLLGNGNWRVKKIISEGQFIKELLLEEMRTKKQHSYKFYPTESTLRTAFKLGEVETIKDLSDPKELWGWPNVRITQNIEKDKFVAVFLNTQDSHLSEKSLRQTLSYTIKKQEGKPRATGPISPNSWAYNSLVKPYEHNPQRAKQFFGQLKPEQRPKSLSLVTIPSLLETAEEIAKDWRELGTDVVVQVSAGVPDNFQALIATQAIPPDPDQYALWHSTQTETNITHYNNPRIDKLLEDGRRTLNQDARRRIYLDFQRFLVEDAPAIFLYHPKTYTITRK